MSTADGFQVPVIPFVEEAGKAGTAPPATNKEISNNKPNLNVFVPSLHVYTYKDGNVRINLPETDDKKYSIKFFDEANSFVFEIKEIKQTSIMQAGSGLNCMKTAN